MNVEEKSNLSVVEKRKLKVILLCAREDGHAGVVLDIIREFSLFEVVGFLDDKSDLQGKEILGIPVIGTILGFENKFVLSDGKEYFDGKEIDGFFVCTGNNKFRKICQNMVEGLGGRMINVIHPDSIVSKSVTFSNGIFVGPRVVLVHNVKVGRGSLINSGAIVDHDSVLEDFVFLCPGTNVAGNVYFEEGSFLGIGASVIPGKRIGSWAVVGAGSVVINDVLSKEVVVGVPAKNIRSD